MLRKRVVRTVTVVASLLIIAAHSGSTTAQADTGVWVTTQDFTVLRVGPSQFFERISVLPPSTTLQATGRTIDGQWIQVIYNGEIPADYAANAVDATVNDVTYGWVAYWLLIWSGNLLDLPIDGVETVSYARSARTQITIGPETYFYKDGVDPSTRMPNLTEERTVELTGRIGNPSVGFFWIQFEMDGEYFWTASWDIGSGGYWLLLDGSYIYTYGRLRIQINQEYSRSRSRLNSIARRWRDLDRGETVSCNNIPSQINLLEDNLRQSDLQRATLYSPAVRALQDANREINTAIELFRDVCSRQGADRFIRPEEVASALIHVDAAARNITLVDTLLAPLTRRDPLLYD